MRTVWFLWLFSCSAGEEGPVFSDLRATFDDHLPTVLHIEATVDPASSVVLRYGSSKEAMVQALQRESGRTHTWTLTGLPQGSDLAFTVETTDESGQAVRGPIGEISVPKLGVPSLQLEVYDPKQSTLTDQWILVSLVRETGSALVAYTADGQAVWGYKAPADRTLAWPTVDGSDVVVLDVHRDRNIDDTYLRRIPIAGGAWEETRLRTGHHGYALLPGGDVAWLGLTFWNQDVSALGVGETEWRVYGDTVLRAPEGSVDDEAQLFSYETDYPEPFFLPCDHPLNVEDRLGELDVHEWTHANSIAHVPEWNALLFGSRLHDSIVALDAETGEWLWQAGGEHGWPVADPWSHGHFSDVWAGGMLYFDNALESGRPVSRVLRLEVDPDSETVSTVWSFEHPNQVWSEWLGDAKRLDNEHVLVTYTPEGELMEATPQGAVVWWARAAGWYVGRVTTLDPSELGLD